MLGVGSRKLSIKYIYSIERGSQIRFLCWSSILIEFQIGDVGFCAGRKTGESGGNHLLLPLLPSEQTRTINKLIPLMAPSPLTIAQSLLPEHVVWIILSIC